MAIPGREFLMRKREGENVASCTERHILDPIDHVTHRRSVHRLARIEVPECTAGPSLNRFQRPGIIPKEHQSTGGGQRPSPGIAVADLGITPDWLSL